MNNIRRFIETQDTLTYFQQEHIAQERSSFRKRNKVRISKQEIAAAKEQYFMSGGKITKLEPFGGPWMV